MAQAGETRGASCCPHKPGAGPEQDLDFLDLQAQGDAEPSLIHLIIEHFERALEAAAKLGMPLVAYVAEQRPRSSSQPL